MSAQDSCSQAPRAHPASPPSKTLPRPILWTTVGPGIPRDCCWRRPQVTIHGFSEAYASFLWAELDKHLCFVQGSPEHVGSCTSSGGRGCMKGQPPAGVGGAGQTSHLLETSEPGTPVALAQHGAGPRVSASPKPGEGVLHENRDGFTGR